MLPTSRPASAEVPRTSLQNPRAQSGWAWSERFRIDAVHVLDFSAPLTAFGIELIAEDGDEPRKHLAVRLEQFDLIAGA